jgi:hypothetical protein
VIATDEAHRQVENSFVKMSLVLLQEVCKCLVAADTFHFSLKKLRLVVLMMSSSSTTTANQLH